MRTTIDISDDLLVELKQIAAETRRSLRDLVDDAIRASLAARRNQAKEAAPASVITFRGKGVQRGVNLDSMRELLDIMEGSS